MTFTRLDQSDLHARLGYKPLHRGWAKVEIALGLTAVGSGLLLANLASTAGGWSAGVAGLALFVLGGYLTLAGHRSHLYQSANELTAYLSEKINQAKG